MDLCNIFTSANLTIVLFYIKSLTWFHVCAFFTPVLMLLSIWLVQKWCVGHLITKTTRNGPRAHFLSISPFLVIYAKIPKATQKY
jgi:hypothetical protein